MRLKDNRGIALVSVYLLTTALLGFTSAIYVQTLQQNKSAVQELEAMQALYNAEEAIAYAQIENYESNGAWFTHQWNNTKTQLVLASTAPTINTDATKVAIDASGYYTSSDGRFRLKSYPDKDSSGNIIDEVAVVRAMGIAGNTRRVIEKRLSNRVIHRYYIWSQNSMYLSWSTLQANGGRIHTNGSVYLYNANRINDFSELSTGEAGTIRYQWNQYYSPHYIDGLDGVIDGKSYAPMLNSGYTYDADNDGIAESHPHIWKTPDTTDSINDLDEMYPWEYIGSDGDRHVRWQANGYPRSWDPTRWPPYDWQETNSHFYGNSNPVNNDSTTGLNYYNTWLKKSGTGAYIQIPETIPQDWQWDKYYGDSSSTQSIQFVDSQGNPMDASYWANLQATLPYLNNDLSDGIYGNDVAGQNRTIAAQNTNSKEQPQAWKDLLKAQGLDGVVRESNTGGYNATPPTFSTIYKNKAQAQGWFLDLDNCVTDTDDSAARETCLQNSIDKIVTNLNTQAGSQIAKRVEFIDTYTTKKHILIDLDAGGMDLSGVYPTNGIIYSKVPIRVSNAEKLPGTEGFDVISEENVYLKGDFNTNPGQWKTAAVISKKRVYTLSNDFNDPQTAPSFTNYTNYPYVYDADGNPDTTADFCTQSCATTTSGVWRDDDDDGLSQSQSDAIRAVRDAANATWQTTQESQMPNRINNAKYNPDSGYREVTYNALIAASRSNVENGPPVSVPLERWWNNTGNEIRRRIQGSFFILPSASQGGDFSAQNGNYVDRESSSSFTNRRMPIEIVSRGNQACYSMNGIGTRYCSSGYFFPTWARTPNSYDSRLYNAPTNASTIFFGATNESWAEVSPDSF